MQVIVKKAMVDSLVNKLVKEERSFHSKNVSELEKAAPPIFPQSEMAQQLSTSKVPIEDNEFVPTNKDELGKAAMQLSHKVEDELIEQFYKNFKTLIKKFESINEAKLPSFLGEPVEEPRPRGAAARRAARMSAAEPDQVYIPSTPAEDAADIAASITPQTQGIASPETAKRKRAKRTPGGEPTTKSARSSLETPRSDSYDPVAEYLKSLYVPRPRPEWMQNVTMNLSDMAVGDANKLLAAIIKKMGEENVTVDSLEDAAMNAINNLTYSLDGNNIVIASPEYKVKFTYNTEGNPKNLFSLEQYQEILTSLASQKYAGAGSQESWGPKYAAAIKDLTYARNDRELEMALLKDLPKIQETLTDAVLDSYPSGTNEFNTREVADKLDILNDQIVDAFIQSGLRTGVNSVSQDAFGKTIEVSLVIPETPGAMQAIADNRFGGVLLSLLSATPDELRAYVAKKKRNRRSAVQMTRGEENYFYDLGMKIGGKNFKMSAAEFQERLQAALEARDDAGLELSDEDIVNMILTKIDIIDPSQVEILAKVQDYVYTLFEKYMQSNPALVKSLGLDSLFEVIPEDLGGLTPAVRDIFDKFFKEIIMIYTDKQIITPFFNAYDAVVNDPATKAYFKDTAGVKHSQIYDQPGAGRRAKDVSNFVGNLRHISEFIKNKSKLMRKSGSTIAASKLERAAEELVDPDVVVDSMESFFKGIASAPKPIQIDLEKVIKKISNEIIKTDPNLLSNAERDETRAGRLAALVAASKQKSADLQQAPVSSPAAVIPEEQPADPNAINKTYDDIISAYSSAPEDVKEKMMDDFEETVLLDEPSDRQLRKYPALKTAADYKILIDKLAQLNESITSSLLLNLIHGYTRG